MHDSPIARLLIVDDEGMLVKALCLTLQKEGYATTGFTSPAEALQALRGGGFDIVITDLMMPGMNGIALLHAAREIDPDFAGILMTGHGTIGTVVDAMKAGALDYILKPFDLEVILTVLARALAIRRLREEKAALVRQVAEHTTELEAANRELKSANDELDAFAHSVSHDLRAPLRALEGLSQILMEDFAAAMPAGAQPLLERMKANVRRMGQLTDGLLNLSRLGRRPLAKQAVNVGELVERVINELQAAEPQRPIRIHRSPLPDATADPLLLQQVFVNLLSNAFKFTRCTEGATIEIKGHRDGDECVYSVQDNGAGFDMRHAQKLFGIFQRLHSAADFDGTGVGLSIVQRVIARHGGGIRAESQVGKGATFTFSLPAS